MRIVHSAEHRHHQPAEIVARGQAIPHVEIARRAEELLAAARAGGHAIEQPVDYGAAPRAAVHDPGYLEFLETAWRRWQSELADPPPLVQPHCYPNRRMSGRPGGIVGLAGYHIATNSAPIAEGTWAAAVAAANVAVHAATLVLEGEDAAYALCRPPGHHAFADLAGGFCYLNNVAIAAQWVLGEQPRVAILDVDVHHGNGTQDIFYRRRDCLFVSLHADPTDYFPFFAGYAHERGEGDGLGYNLNLPLPHGTGDDDYLAALGSALGAIRRYAPDTLLVSLGFDAFAGDPIGALRLSTDGFARIGEAIGRLRIPTVLVQEGGYDCDHLGANLAAFLAAFEDVR